jgi:hypothetical protein
MTSRATSIAILLAGLFLAVGVTFLCLRQQGVEVVPPTDSPPIYSNDLLSRRLARFEPEAGMTMDEVRGILGEPQQANGTTWRYFPFHVGDDRYRLTLVFADGALVSWEWAWP